MGVFPHILKNIVSSISSPDETCCGKFLQVSRFSFYTFSCGNRSHCNKTCGGLFDGNHIAVKTGRTGENPLTLSKALQSHRVKLLSTYVALELAAIPGMFDQN